MQRVRSARRHFPTPIWRLLTVLVSLGQLLVASAAWLDRAPDATGARVHVEDDGTHLHHGHSASDCELCAVQHLGGVPATPRALRATAAPTRARPSVQGSPLVPADRLTANGPRAPPNEL